MSETRYLLRPDGKVAYSAYPNQGPWILCIPSMGDIREEYRLIRPGLSEAGYSLALMDVRGHGESSSGFGDYSAAAVGGDAVALMKELSKGPWFVIGTSMGAAAGIWAAAELPDAVAGLALVGPFTRDMPVPPWTRALMRLLFLRPWGPTFWDSYYRRLYRSRLPEDFQQYRSRLRRNLSEPGRLEALRAMIDASKGPCEARIPEVRCRSLVVMGARDPDFPDPLAEAQRVAERLSGEVFLLDGAGHYPHAELPDKVIPRLLAFLNANTRGGEKSGK